MLTPQVVGSFLYRPCLGKTTRCPVKVDSRKTEKAEQRFQLLPLEQGTEGMESESHEHGGAW